jgi:ParB/RepB/Spo0J family partition protein
MNTLSIALENLRPDPANARHVCDNDVSSLAASIDRVGLLQPIVVRPDGDSWLVVAGNRRVQACRTLGRTHIDAVEFAVDEDHEAVAASAAENMVRMPMHPVDTWRAMTALIDGGYSREGAADALGVSHVMARRLDHLGRMAPQLVDAIATQAELPQASIMRTIALAPTPVQQKALAAASRGGKVDWWRVAQGCETTRIPMTRAIFDTEAASVTFDEDLFAQPDDDERFTTTDIAGFLKAQCDALDAKATASKGRMTAYVWSRPLRLRDRMPKGWAATYDDPPKRWKKDDPRHLFASVIGEGYEIGAVEYVVAAPKVDRPAAAATVGTETVRERSPISKMTINRLAMMKREAVVERLPLIAANANPSDMLRALLLVLTFENVSLWDSDRRYGTSPYRDLARHLVDHEGKPVDLSEAQLCVLAADAIGRVVKFEGADIANSSGPQAEWLAAMVGAEMPRCDSEEILKGLTKDALIELARQHGISEQGKTVEIRGRLIGHLPDWRPADFGAKGPSGYHFEREQADDESDDAEEAA